MNTPAIRLAAAAVLVAAASAHAQLFFFDSSSGWLARNSTNSSDISFLGRNESSSFYNFADGTLTANQWGGSVYSPFDGRVAFSVQDNPQGNNDSWGRVATGFGWSISGSDGYVWSNIPSNRQGAMTGNNPTNGTYFASKVGDQFQMQVHASNYYTTGGTANAMAALRDAPLINRVSGSNNTMTDLSILDLDPNRPGVQVNPGNYPVHLNVDAATGSRAQLDFSALPGFGNMPSPFRDDMTRTGSFYVGSGADVRFNESIGSGSVTWGAREGTNQQTIAQTPIDRLMAFTNADIGKVFDVRFRVNLTHTGYDADGLAVGTRPLDSFVQAFQVEVVPTPGTGILGGLGSLLIFRRRRRQ